jgi:hypothetical protein
VWVTGGQLTVTNGTTYIGAGATSQMTVSNGAVLASEVLVAHYCGSQGSALTVVGGAETISSDLIIGDCDSCGSGVATVDSGSLIVTNATNDAYIDVRHGQLVLNGGVLRVDRLILTNSCGQFIRNGGTLIAGTLVLDPDLDADGDGIPNGWEQAHGLDPLNPGDANLDNDGDGLSNLQEYLAGTDPNDPNSKFRITGITREGDDVRITWTMGSDRINDLQVATGDASGNYAGDFAELFLVTNTVGSVTNYLDVGGATNRPARFYRVQILPQLP